VTVAERFGSNLARHRKAADLTQEEASFAAGVHRTEIGLLERGRRIPRIDTLVKLAATVGVRPETLLEGIVWNPGTIRRGSFTPAAEET
jgi:transcriptional regulator with XRE-family HTH domain